MGHFQHVQNGQIDDRPYAPGTFHPGFPYVPKVPGDDVITRWADWVVSESGQYVARYGWTVARLAREHFYDGYIRPDKDVLEAAITAALERWSAK